MADREEPQIHDPETTSQPLLKRKSSLEPVDGGDRGSSTKQHKSDVSIEESTDVGLAVEKDEASNQNGSSSFEKGKSDLAATDKGPVEIVVVENQDAADGGKHGGSKNQYKPDNSIEESADACLVLEEDEAANLNGSSSIEKGKSVLTAADKGKGKMVVAEADDSDEQSGQELENSSSDDDDSSDENEDISWIGDKDSEESGFCDDPLTEVDLDNILPSRIRRRRPLEPGAYLVEDGEEDEDEDENEWDDDTE